MNPTEKILHVCRAIPQGRVASYGQIARLCGAPKNARQVGAVLAHTHQQGIPAHRVVNSKGILSGAAAFLMADMQKSLLEAEGVEVDPRKGVDLKRFGWNPTEEEQKALQVAFDQREET